MTGRAGLLMSAVRRGDLWTVRRAHARGTLLQPGVHTTAASLGHLKILRWAARRRTLGGWCAASIAYHAALGGRRRVLRWALRKGADPGGSQLRVAFF